MSRRAIRRFSVREALDKSFEPDEEEIEPDEEPIEEDVSEMEDNSDPDYEPTTDQEEAPEGEAPEGEEGEAPEIEAPEGEEGEAPEIEAPEIEPPEGEEPEWQTGGLLVLRQQQRGVWGPAACHRNNISFCAFCHPHPGSCKKKQRQKKQPKPILTQDTRVMRQFIGLD
ncbi:hypothetical protein NQZ68_033383 [Dissostichus eleginoides]|nr:hypothetical protein NQZ68_033383 [Dissostichus eleginoides]